MGRRRTTNPYIPVLLFSDYRLKVVKEKAFLISQVLDETKVDASSSGLGLDGFRKLIKEVKKARGDGDSGEFITISRTRINKRFGCPKHP
jgi:hypothetical protein